VALPWDPEVEMMLAPLLVARAERGLPAVGDVATRRANSQLLFEVVSQRAGIPVQPVTVTDHAAPADDGHLIPLRLYRPDRARQGPLVVDIHGGGMISGTLDQNDALVRSLSARSELPVLTPDYRLAPEHPDPTPVEDCYAAVLWAAAHAAELGVDPSRICVMGASAGGGLAAGVTLLARDRGAPAIARQLLVYPMLDDRSLTPDPEMAEKLLWSVDDNRTGWTALLGASAGSDADDVSIYAAPARATDLSGLPPAYIDVGGLDHFRDEDVDYATRLQRCGVPVELHVVPGAPHAFDILAPESALGRQVTESRLRFLGGL
jgi:acetyl esterase/lipase